MYNTKEEALHHLQVHRDVEHGGLPGPLGLCLTCRSLEERVKDFYRGDYPGATPQSVVPGRDGVQINYFEDPE